jgi:hypothetical protein
MKTNGLTISLPIERLTTPELRRLADAARDLAYSRQCDGRAGNHSCTLDKGHKTDHQTTRDEPGYDESGVWSRTTITITWPRTIKDAANECAQAPH